MMPTVIAIVSGMDEALVAVMRKCRRNSSSTITASTAPTIIASRNRRHGIAHQLRLIVDGLEVNAGRQREVLAAIAGDAVGDGERVTARLPRDVDLRRRPAIARDDVGVIFGPHQLTVARSRTRNPWPTTTLATSSSECASVVVTHEVLLVIRRQTPDSADGRGLLDGVRQILERHPLGRQPRGIGFTTSTSRMSLASTRPRGPHPARAR